MSSWKANSLFCLQLHYSWSQQCGTIDISLICDILSYFDLCILDVVGSVPISGIVPCLSFLMFSFSSCLPIYENSPRTFSLCPSDHFIQKFIHCHLQYLSPVYMSSPYLTPAISISLSHLIIWFSHWSDLTITSNWTYSHLKSSHFLFPNTYFFFPSEAPFFIRFSSLAES